MLKKLSLLLILLLPLAATACSESPGDAIKIYKAWARETQNAKTPAGVFMTIENHGPDAIVLKGFTSTISPRVELHAVETINGMNSMNAKPDLTIPGESTFDFGAEHYHFMLWDISQKISKGDSFQMTLSFEAFGDIVVDVMVTGVDGMESMDH